jgi:hypothetical protein
MIAILALAYASLWAGPASAAVPPVDGKGSPALSVCPTTSNVARVYHFDKVIFTITGQLKAAAEVDQPALSALPLNTEMDIKIIDNPRTVAYLKAKVLTFLGADVKPGPDGANNPNFNSIRILEVEYAAIVCPKTP